MRKLLTVLAATTALLASTLSLQPAQAAIDGDDLVINEVYARGGSANQPYSRKFVEILNPTDAAVSLSGWALSYSAAGNENLGQQCALSGSVAAGENYLVDVGTNNAGSPAPGIDADLECTNINPGGANGSYSLLQGETVIDMVGWGTAVRYEGAGAAAYPGGNSDPGSISRTDGKDTDDNAADFTFSDTPTPQGGSAGDEEEEGEEEEEETPTTVTIAEIQGAGDATPLSGQVVTTTGIVTAAYPTGGFNGAYLQTPGSGGTAKAAGDASDGIFVYGSAAAAATVGQCYEVTGTAGEYNSLTQLSNPTLVPAEGCAAVVVTELEALPQTDADKEVYEGMLVQPLGTYTISNNYALNQFGQLGLAFGDQPLFQATDVVAPGADADAYEAANRLKEITLDDGSSWNFLSNNTAKNSALPYLSEATPMRTGSQVSFTGPVILDYRFQWNYQPTGHVVGAEVSFLTTENDRPATPAEVGGDVKLAAFNVLNYFDDLGVDEEDCRFYADMNGDPVATNFCQVRGAYSESAFADQEAKIVAAINGLGADVVGLQEIETSSQITYLPGQPRDKAVATLVAALNAAGGNWAVAPSPLVTPTNEDVIRTAFIYNPDTIELVGPSYIFLDPAFADAREPFAQEFKVIGSETSFVAINNHFKSKGSGEDDGTGQGNANPSREAQATALSNWANTFEEFEDKAVFLLGDFNSYTKETPLQILEDAGFVNQTAGGVNEQATYQFSGRLGSLDHVFANPKADELVTGASVWNINGDESIAFQYSRRNYNIIDFHADDVYASSDHDPVLVGIKAPAIDEPDPPAKFERTAPYTLPGIHRDLNGRDWHTTCESYSQTERCRTEIWATTVVIENGRFVRKDAWVFNNLTYLPYMTRAAWGANPLANAGRWTAETDGRQWMTECDTPRTGGNGCRTYAYSTVYQATPRAGGGYTFSQSKAWVFNNIVMFGSPAQR